MDENTLRKNKEKVPFGAALARILNVAEDEGYAEGWDAAFDIGYQSGGHSAAHVFVEALCKANDIYINDTYKIDEDGKEQNAEYDRTINFFLALLEEILPFRIDWDNCVPVFPEDEENEEEYEDNEESTESEKDNKEDGGE